MPEHVKRTFDGSGIPEADEVPVGRLGAQTNQRNVYDEIDEDLANRA